MEIAQTSGLFERCNFFLKNGKCSKRVEIIQIIISDNEIKLKVAERQKNHTGCIKKYILNIQFRQEK